MGPSRQVHPRSDAEDLGVEIVDAESGGRVEVKIA
jgi:hypothetical protein